MDLVIVAVSLWENRSRNSPKYRYKSMVRWLVCLTISILISGCVVQSNFGVQDLGDPNSGGSPTKLRKIFFDVTSMTVSEGSAALVSVQMTDKLSVDTVIHLSLSGDTSVIQSLPNTVTIPAGSLSTPLTIQTNEDLIYKGTLSLQITLIPNDSSLQAEPNTLSLTITDNDLPTVLFTSAAQTVDESIGTVNVNVQLDAAAANVVTIPIVLTGTATQGSGSDYTISSTTLTIGIGQSSAIATVTINNDSSYESAETIILTMGVPTNAALGSPAVHIITITDNDLGTFSISGITGGADVTANAALVGGVLATVNWGASAGASSYDVTIYAADGTTVICATQNTVSTTFDFSSCSLTIGTSYKAKVVAKLASLVQDASNNLYSFLVNSTPVANNDGPPPSLELILSPIRLATCTERPRRQQ